MEKIPRICIKCREIYGCWINGKCMDCKECSYEKCYLEDMTGKTICMMGSHGLCKNCTLDIKKKKMWGG